MAASSGAAGECCCPVAAVEEVIGALPADCAATILAFARGERTPRVSPTTLREQERLTASATRALGLRAPALARAAFGRR